MTHDPRDLNPTRPSRRFEDLRPQDRRPEDRRGTWRPSPRDAPGPETRPGPRTGDGADLETR